MISDIEAYYLLPAIEAAILGAYAKVPGAIRGAHVEIDRRTGHMSVLTMRYV